MYGKTITLVLLAAAPAAAQSSRVVALPDTQNYSRSYPQIFTAQTQWVVDRFVPDGIAFVSHLGDVVNDAGTSAQWVIAADAMRRLDSADVPYGTCPGNHDFRYPGSFFDPLATSYRANFGPQLFGDEPWYRGHSPSELSSYQIIEVDGREILFLHLSVETPPDELVWAQSVLNAHRDLPTWVTTHRYLFKWGPLGAGRYDDFNYFFEPPYVPNGVRAVDFFDNFVAANRQIFLVHCGHNDGEHRQIGTNDFGLPVHEVLADYQTTFGNGGNGWLRTLDFDVANQRIEVQTYSPYLDDFRTGGDSQFTLDVDFDAYVSGGLALRFKDGVGGYQGTRDTWINEDDPGRSYGGDATVIVDNDVANSIFTDREGHGLIKFGDLFQPTPAEGQPAPTRIPTNAQVTRATLTLNLADDTDVFDPAFFVYRMTTPWSEGSTWNALGGGVDVGVDTAPGLLGSFQGDNDPSFETARSVDVTAAVAAWLAGAPVEGFAILPEDLAFNDDGIEIRSREDGSSTLRPSLDVEFTYEPTNVPPTVDQTLATSEATVFQHEEVVLTAAATDPNPLDPLVFAINGVDVGFATGSGALEHRVRFDLPGTYTFTATVRDEAAQVPAGAVTVQVLPRETTGTFDPVTGTIKHASR